MISVPNMFDPDVQQTGKPKHARAMLFGVDRGFQKRGIDALLMESAVQMAKSKGIDAYEVGWVLESNKHWRKQLETACGPSMTGYRRYRIYEQSV